MIYTVSAVESPSELGREAWNLVWQGGSQESPNAVEESSCETQAGLKHPLHFTGREAGHKEVIIKNSDRSELLPFLQANKLASHVFMDASRNERLPSQTQMTSLLMVLQVVRASWSFALQVPVGWY